MKKLLYLLTITTLLISCDYLDKETSLKIIDKTYPRLTFQLENYKANYDKEKAEDYKFEAEISVPDKFTFNGEQDGASFVFIEIKDLSKPITHTFKQFVNGEITIYISAKKNLHYEFLVFTIDYTTPSGSIIPITVSEDLPNLSFSTVESGDYYVGSKLGKYDYIANSNVTLKKYFLIQDREVSYALYYKVFNWAIKNKYKFAHITAIGTPNNGSGAAPSEEDKNTPATNVTYYNMLLFCNALSEMTGETPVYFWSDNDFNNLYYSIKSWEKCSDITINKEATGYRLPTEVEWEIAARGGMPAIKAGTYGTTYSGSNEASNVAWTFENSSPNSVKESATKAANELGIYDMSGNLHECCTHPHTKLFPDTENNLGFSEYVLGDKTLVANRGGSYFIEKFSVAKRSYHIIRGDMYRPFIGFRLVKNK